jgi:phage-related protein
LFKNIWNNVVEAVKTVLGIASPSQVFTDIANWIIDAIINVITFLPKLFLEHFTTMWTNAANFFTNTIGPALLEWPAKITALIKGIWNGFFNYLKDTWQNIVDFYGPNGKVVTFLKGLPRKFVDWLKGVWQGLLDDLTNIYNKVMNFFGENSDIARFIRGLGTAIKNWASGMWNGLTNGLTTAVNVIKSALRPLINVLNNMIDGANWVADALPGDPAFVIPNIPTNFAMGGTVYPQAGGVLARVAEAGRPERIEPLDPEGLSVRDRAIIDRLSGGGKGVTVNVYPSEGMDEKELAAIVSRQIAFATRRGAA